MRQREKKGQYIPEPALRIGVHPNGHAYSEVVTDSNPSSKILSRAEVVKRMAECQQYALTLWPYAIRVIAEVTRSENPRLRSSAAIKLCEIAGISQSGGSEQVLETAEAEDQRQAEKRLLFLGVAMDTMMQKSDLYKMPLPPGFARDMKELNDRVQELARQPESEEETAPFRYKARPAPSSSPERSRL